VQPRESDTLPFGPGSHFGATRSIGLMSPRQRVSVIVGALLDTSGGAPVKYDLSIGIDAPWGVAIGDLNGDGYGDVYGDVAAALEPSVSSGDAVVWLARPSGGSVTRLGTSYLRPPRF
jgi:hypothetical protein